MEHIGSFALAEPPESRLLPYLVRYLTQVYRSSRSLTASTLLTKRTDRCIPLESASNAVVSLIGQIQTAMASPQIATRMSAMSSDSPMPPIPGGGGTNGYTPNGGPSPMPDPGTNLWVSPMVVAGGSVTGIGSNTLSDVYYEIQSRTNLAQSDWQSEGFIAGSELTNWTALSVPQNGRPSLFIRLKSWIDDTGTGIPDWWWLQYFGQITNVDAYASAEGDGFDNLYKFQNGLVPTNYFNPNGPPRFFGYLDATGTNVFIAWSSAPGPVVSYSIQRGVSIWLSGFYSFSQVGTVSSNANFIEDVGAINNSNALNNIYQLETVFPNGSLSGTDTWYVSWYIQYGANGLPFGPPVPTNFYACADTNAANVLLSWTPASGVATNYLIERGIFNTTSNAYVYHQVASVSPATNIFKVTGPFTNANNWSDNYAIIAVYPGNVSSPLAVSPVNVGNTNGLAAPSSFYGYTDGTGTNLVLAWTTAAGTPTNYVIFAGNTNSLGFVAYVKLATAKGGTNTVTVTNGVDGFGNPLYAAYAVFAVYADGSFSQAAFWQSVNGTPAPGNFIAYIDGTGTNVWLSWTAPSGAITGYQIARFDPLGDIFEWNISSNITWFEDTNAVHMGSFDPLYTEYTVQALYPQGGASSTAIASVGTVPAPTDLSATLDASGKNVDLTWNASPGAASYAIYRGVLNPSTGTYSYSQIGTVGSGATSYQDTGAITGANSYNNQYEVKAIYPGGEASGFDTSSVSESSAVPLSNVYASANLIRNETGRWQVMFSGLPTNSPQTVQLSWNDGFDNVFQTNLTTTVLTNGIFLLPDAFASALLDYEVTSGLALQLTVQLFGPNGEPGQVQAAGFFSSDAPYFVDGRQHMKQNLLFLVRAAAIDKPFGGTYLDTANTFLRFNQTATNFETFSFFHREFDEIWWSDESLMQLDNLWPFSANYFLENFLVDTTRTNFPYGTTNFNFQINFATNIPAPPILSANPFYTLQPGILSYELSPSEGVVCQPVNTFGGHWGITLQNTQTVASLQSNLRNLYQLPYQSGVDVDFIYGTTDPLTGLPAFVWWGGTPIYYQSLPTGGTVPVQEPNYYIGAYASQTAVPTLQITNYYFAPIINPWPDSMQLPGAIDPTGQGIVQPYPLPVYDDFNVTNQTPPLIGSVGQPMIIGGWAKYSIQNGSTFTGKYAYLGQYFVTNAFLLSSNGVPTTNSAGVMSPYGEFFPLQAGVAQVVTMPDVDSPHQQGTNVVKIISMNVDANHDGVMDLSYQGPDFISASRPYRFWANDNQDDQDFGGNFGVPGYEPVNMEDGFRGTPGFVPALTPSGLDGGTNYQVHGRRDLVDFFPVYLNIGSLFQSNALSAGISPTDTNYQFVLSQADGVLRFVYTDLAPTNYMNFLLDTTESGDLANQIAWPISAQGIPLNNFFNSSFLGNVAANNGAIILVEAAAPTAQPLVLTIYHGTNQIAQTSLPLSISGVEQMFRNKNILLYSTPTVPDRLTDASVPNEPDTIDKNFVFMHGYNVNPNEARGVAADMYKRMYWSGSHAKFWTVTWEGASSKLGSLFTPNYHTNVVNAFNTAPLLANFIASLTNSGPVVAAAHSLGNMLTLSAISDWNAPVSQYFMMDAAVPIEAIDPASTNVSFMTFSTWADYTNRLFAANWHQLFPTNDARSTLFWNNRLGNLGSVDLYNFYSSGEEVLRLTAGDPPLSTINILATQLINRFSLVSLWPDVPFGTYSWYWQEKGKGTCNEDGLIGSSHGGWKFSTYWVDSHGNPLSPPIMNTTSNSILQTQPMFDFNSTANNFLLDVDSELLGSVPGVNPSTYAATYRNRILSDAIPAMSLVAGANPIPKLSPPISPSQKNIDMMTLKNGWSAGRTSNEAGMWHHSDFVQMAYTFTHQLFDTFVTTGNLK